LGAYSFKGFYRVHSSSVLSSVPDTGPLLDVRRRQSIPHPPTKEGVQQPTSFELALRGRRECAQSPLYLPPIFHHIQQ
jgi:hypothetical protein